MRFHPHVEFNNKNVIRKIEGANAEKVMAEADKDNSLHHSRLPSVDHCELQGKFVRLYLSLDHTDFAGLCTASGDPSSLEIAVRSMVDN